MAAVPTAYVAGSATGSSFQRARDEFLHDLARPRRSEARLFMVPSQYMDSRIATISERCGHGSSAISLTPPSALRTPPQLRWGGTMTADCWRSSLAQAICGCTRLPRPQSVEAMTRARPTSPAKRPMRSPTSSGCVPLEEGRRKRRLAPAIRLDAVRCTACSIFFNNARRLALAERLETSRRSSREPKSTSRRRYRCRRQSKLGNGVPHSGNHRSCRPDARRRGNAQRAERA
jgi:hypothetical protein